MKRFLNKSERRAQLTILGVLFLWILIVISTGNAKAQSSHLNWYRNYQESVEYPERIKNNTSFTLKSAKTNKKGAKKKNKVTAKKNRHKRKVSGIREQTSKIRNK